MASQSAQQPRTHLGRIQRGELHDVLLRQRAVAPEFDTKRRKLLICLKRLPEFATTAM